MILTTDMVINTDIETSRTYKLSETELRGYTDESEALRQAIYKGLNTERYEYPIYSFSYGVELEDLVRMDPDYVRMELKRRITEYLQQDDRITGVNNFSFTITDDNLLCTFNVSSIYGTATITQEVSI